MGFVVHARSEDETLAPWLRVALAFDDADLAANRDGRRSPAQRRRERRFTFIVTSMWIAVGLATLGGIHSLELGDVLETIVTAFGSVVLVVACGVLLVRTLRASPDDERVLCAEGEARWVQDDDATRCYVGDVHVDLGALVFRRRLEGRRVGVYYSPMLAAPLSVEMLP